MNSFKKRPHDDAALAQTAFTRQQTHAGYYLPYLRFSSLYTAGIK
jgi:hypothetical protein